MVTIKIEVGFDKEHAEKKKDSEMKKAVLIAAFVDSVVWIADTALLLKLFYSMPLYPFGMYFITGVFFLYIAYLIIKTQLLTRKYGKKINKDEFGHTGVLLAVASAVLLFFLTVMSYV